MSVTIDWCDGYLSLAPVWPEGLEKKLTFWQKRFQQEGWKRVVVGQNCRLYEVQPVVDPSNAQQVIGQRLVTLPGSW